MTAYPDTFNRADGPLGDGWTVHFGSMSISNHMATASTLAMAYATGQSEIGEQDHYIVVPIVNGEIGSARVLLKKVTNSNNCWWVMVSKPTSQLRVSCGYIYGMTDAMANYQDIDMPAGTSITLRGTFNSTTISAIVGETVVTEPNDHSFDSAGEFGFEIYSNNGLVDSFDAPGGESASFAVTPDPLWIGGGAQQMLATGAGTNWTPGVPGSSIITADHGTVSEQWTADATTIHFMYTPAEYVGVITFTESESGLQATINGTVVPQEGQTPIGQLSTEAIAYIERSAIAQDTPTILNQDFDPWSVYPPVAMYEFLRDLYKRVTGNEEPPIIPYPSSSDLNELYARIWGGEEWLNASFVPPGTNSLGSKADYLTTQMDALRTVVPYDLADVQNNLSTDWTYSIKAVYQLIEAGVPVDLQAVIDLLLSIRGSDTASIAYNELLIKGIGGLNGYSLDDIKAWVESARGAGLPSIADILTKLGPSGINVDTQLSGILQAAVAGETYALNANDAIHRIEGVPQRTLQNILDAIANIPGGSNQDVLDALSVIVGVPTTTLRAIMDYLITVRGDGTTTLKMILDAAQADPANTNYSIPALLALLMAALMGGTGAVTSLIAKLVDGKLDLVLDILGVIIDGANFFHTLWDHFNPSSATYSPITVPVYPGIDKVQLLDPVPFVDGCNLALRMDGALIDIATPGEHPYAIKNTNPTRYGRLGTFAFAADTARLECIQPIQYLTFIATPRAIALPTGIVVQCKSGTVGTVVPYRLT